MLFVRSYFYIQKYIRRARDHVLHYGTIVYTVTMTQYNKPLYHVVFAVFPGTICCTVLKIG